jgi:phenylalanyl-tRNA synthetase alpha chain
MNLEESLNKIWLEAEKEFNLVGDLKRLEELKIKYLGRKSYLANFPSLLKNLDIEEKRKIGSLYNQLKEKIQNLYLEKRKSLSEEKIFFDFEHPGKEIKIGHQHLISQNLEKIKRIFIQLGFSIVDYEEIVSEKENFDYLNVPQNHPARDMWDTLWVKNYPGYLFRTHTSVFQTPVLKKFGPPIRAVIFGKVFRYEATDRTHDFEFYQLDGISISENTNLGNLKWVVEKFFEKFFEEKIEIRFRPSYFPFVEPGFEIDIKLCFM